MYGYRLSINATNMAYQVSIIDYRLSQLWLIDDPLSIANYRLWTTWYRFPTIEYRLSVPIVDYQLSMVDYQLLRDDQHFDCR